MTGVPGTIKLHKKDRKWFLQVDGTDHEIKSRKPSFDHAEKMLRTMGKMAYDYDRRVKVAADDEPKTQTITIEFKDRYGVTGPAILKALHFLKWCGGVGTSQSLKTDMNDKTFLHFDGDGAAQIDAIKLNGEETKAPQKDIDEYTKVTR